MTLKIKKPVIYGLQTAFTVHVVSEALDLQPALPSDNHIIETKANSMATAGLSFDAFGITANSTTLPTTFPNLFNRHLTSTSHFDRLDFISIKSRLN